MSAFSVEFLFRFPSVDGREGLFKVQFYYFVQHIGDMCRNLINTW